MRRMLETLLKNGKNKKEIAKILEVFPSTIFREINKCKGFYNAEEAQIITEKRLNYFDKKIIGKRFGLLTVIEYANKIRRRSWFNCRCECGKLIIMKRKILTARCSKDRLLSCGCIAKESKGPNGQVPIEEAMLRKYQDLLSFRKIKNSCWIWTGYKQKGKIPKTSWKNKSMGVRKCMYLLMNGIQDESNPVYSKCGNLFCFNPDHITLEIPRKRFLYTDQISLHDEE